MYDHGSRAALVAAAATISLVLVRLHRHRGRRHRVTEDGLIDFLNFGDFGGGRRRAELQPLSCDHQAERDRYMYEPLMYVETYSCEAIPWLATGYEWTDPQTLVFDHPRRREVERRRAVHRRGRRVHVQHDQGVPGLDLRGVWAYLDSVRPTATTR